MASDDNVLGEETMNRANVRKCSVDSAGIYFVLFFFFGTVNEYILSFHGIWMFGNSAELIQLCFLPRFLFHFLLQTIKAGRGIRRGIINTHGIETNRVKEQHASTSNILLLHLTLISLRGSLRHEGGYNTR